MAEKRSSARWRWVSVYVVILVLAGGGILINVWYNRGQQLTPDKLEQAKQLWKQNGPRDYDLSYQITYDRERLAERHVVLVRDGKIVFASCEGEVIEMAPAMAAVVGFPLGGMGEGGGRDVPVILDHVESTMKELRASERRHFIVARFDPNEGYPRRFVWRISGTRTREEWDVRLWPAGGLGVASHSHSGGSQKEAEK